MCAQPPPPPNPYTQVWEQGTLMRFNWVWHDCTTFQAYDKELASTDTLLARGGAVTIHGAQVVMQSLTRNARRAFWILLLSHLDHAQDPDFRGAFAEGGGEEEDANICVSDLL